MYNALKNSYGISRHIESEKTRDTTISCTTHYKTVTELADT
jgi:hypothetical protein